MAATLRRSVGDGRMCGGWAGGGMGRWGQVGRTTQLGSTHVGQSE